MARSFPVTLDGFPKGKGGITRALRYDWNAIADIEAASQANLIALVFASDTPNLNLRYLVWGGLKWQERRLTLNDVGDILQEFLDNGGDVNALSGLVGDAIVASGVVTAHAPKKDEQDGEEPSSVESSDEVDAEGESVGA